MSDLAYAPPGADQLFFDVSLSLSCCCGLKTATQLSQTLPMPSPSPSAWSMLATVGQLSDDAFTPSPSPSEPEPDRGPGDPQWEEHDERD